MCKIISKNTCTQQLYTYDTFVSFLIVVNIKINEDLLVLQLRHCVRAILTILNNLGEQQCETTQTQRSFPFAQRFVKDTGPRPNSWYCYTRHFHFLRINKTNKNILIIFRCVFLEYEMSKVKEVNNHHFVNTNDCNDVYRWNAALKKKK